MSPARPLQFCRRCLYTDAHPLGLVIDAQGICSGCRIHEEKNQLDWGERWQRLEALVAPYRSASGEVHDCIVPVSGAGDSYFIVHLVKERLRLNPILVNYNKQFNTALGIRNLANLRIRFNCDILVQTLNPQAVRQITRASLRQLGSMYWHCLAGGTVFPVQTAVRFKIPLIIWGAHQGLEQVGMFSHRHEVEMTRRYRADHDLLGCEGDALRSIFDVLREEDIAQLRYPSDHELNAVGVRGIYLGNYVRWDPKAQHEQMIERYGYQTAAFARTFDTYDYVDCYNYMDIHDLLKLYKHGYSKVTDHASREIRHGRLSRRQALALVRRYEGAAPRYLAQFCDWLGVTPRGLQFLLDQHRSPRFWTQTAPGQFQFHGWSTQQTEPADKTHAEDESDLDFICNRSLERGESPRYILIGKGHPD